MEEFENNKSKRKTIILTAIGIITIIGLVIGATFAFYNITTNRESTSTNVTGNTEGLGQAILTNPTPKLHITLSTVDMNKANKGTSYYATNDINKNYDTEETKRSIAIASVGGGVTDTKNQCESTITIEIDGSMKDVLVNGDGKIVLTPTSGVEIDTTEIDLKDLADQTSMTIPVVYKITGNNEEKIEAIMIINNTESDQINLAGKQINITITNTKFQCEVVPEFTKDQTVTEIIENKPNNLNATTEEADDLAYRYQGSASEVTNNYICFGTTSKDECTTNNGQNNYMYRIIGIDKSNRFKLIKKTIWEDRQWHSSTADIKWPESDLYIALNGTNSGQFLETISNTNNGINWQTLIDTIQWKYGDSTNYQVSGSELLQIEKGWSASISARIGLMYLSDYYMGVKNDGVICGLGENTDICKNSWLHLSNNDLLNTNDEEWTMHRYMSGYILNIFRSGIINSIASSTANSRYSVRPVFYLTPNTVIKSGTGTINDPFIIKM